MNTHGATVNRGEIVSMYAGLKTHCLLNGVLDVSLGFIVLPLVHALCSMWAGSELALLNSLSEMLLLRMSGGMMPETTGR